MKRILCTLLLCGLLRALLPAAFADGQVQTVTLNIPCTVTMDVGGHGKVYSTGTTCTGPGVDSFQVWPGTRASFLITPDTGYVVNVLTLSGKDVREGLRYGLYSTVVNRSETLVVRFEKSVPPTVTPTPTVTPAPTVTPTPTVTPMPRPAVSPYPWTTPVPTTPPWQMPAPYGPKTSDESQVGTWMALLLISAASLLPLSRKTHLLYTDQVQKRN